MPSKGKTQRISVVISVDALVARTDTMLAQWVRLICLFNNSCFHNEPLC